MLTRAVVRRFSTESLKVVNDVSKQRFSVSLAGSDAVLGYEQEGKKITFIHTDVPPIFQGKGVGKKLAESAFDHAAKHELAVTCKCHFLEKYYQRNYKKYKNLRIKFELDDDKT